MSIANYRSRISDYNALLAQMKGNLDTEVGTDSNQETGLGVATGIGSIPLLMSGKRSIKELYGIMKKSKEARNFVETEGMQAGESSKGLMDRFKKYLSRDRTADRNTLADASEGRIPDAQMDPMDFGEPADSIPLNRFGSRSKKGYRSLDDEDDEGTINPAFDRSYAEPAGENTPLLGNEVGDDEDPLSGLGDTYEAISDISPPPGFNYADDLLKPIGKGSEGADFGTETEAVTQDLTPLKVRFKKSPLEHMPGDDELASMSHADLRTLAKNNGIRSTGKGASSDELRGKLGKFRDGAEMDDNDFSSTNMASYLKSRYGRSPYLKDKYPDKNLIDTKAVSKRDLIRDVKKAQKEESVGKAERRPIADDPPKKEMGTMDDILGDEAGPSDAGNLLTGGGQSQTETIEQEQQLDNASNTADAQASQETAEQANTAEDNILEHNIDATENVAEHGGKIDSIDGEDTADATADAGADAGAEAGAVGADALADAGASALTLGGALSGVGLVAGVGMGIFSLVELIKSKTDEHKQEQQAQEKLPYIAKATFNATSPADRNVSTSNV